jgi:glycosyltransferase involved in cell wall biosynthesis
MIETQTSMKKRIALLSVNVRDLVGFRGSLIQSLARSGSKVYALASDYSEDSRVEIIRLGAEPVEITMARTRMNPLIDIRDTIRLAKVLKEIAPDILLSSFIKPVIYGTIAGWLAKTPHRVAMIEGLGYVYTENGTELTRKKKILRGVASALYRFALRRAHRVIFLNPDDLKDFSHWRIVDAKKATVLGGIGVDLEEWSFVAPVVKPIRFLFVGRLLREKGIDHFLVAAERVKNRYPEVEFVVLGDIDGNPGSIDATHMQRWVQSGIGEWPGYVKVQPWMARSSVFVLPSFYREGVPRSTQEALAMGRPVITTDSPGCRETVEDGVNGFVVPVRNDSALADAMIRFIKQPELINRMGEESRRLAEKKFNVHEVNQRLMAILGL